MQVIGKALFAPGQFRHYCDVVMADDKNELQRAWGGSSVFSEEECRAYTELYEPVPSRLKLGRMVFNWNDCEIPIVVHECVHAAEHFAEVSLASPAYKQMKRRERQEYRIELMPTIVENLVSQTWKLISAIKLSQV
jgi:hypothetical protein